MIRILHAARKGSGNGKVLDLELLLSQVGGIFKPDEDCLEEDNNLQVALSAQVRKTIYEDRGAVSKSVPYQRRIATQGTNGHNTRTVTSSINLF